MTEDSHIKRGIDCVIEETPAGAFITVGSQTIQLGWREDVEMVVESLNRLIPHSHYKEEPAPKKSRKAARYHVGDNDGYVY